MPTSRSVVAILLPDTTLANALGAELASEQVGVAVVRTSDELHREMHSQRVDVVVIAQVLEGFYSGLEIVEKLQANLSQPAVIFCGTLSSVQREAAQKLRIASILEDDTPFDSLVAAVRCQIFQVDTGESAIPPRARRYAAAAGVVRPMPQLLTKLCTYLNDDSVSMPSLAADLSVDPRITAELLRFTNSTAMGLSRKVTSVQDAVILLGLRQTIAILLGTGVLRAQTDLLKSIPADIQNWYQSRSVLIAGTASVFAKRMEHISPESAHVLGLFQDLGILVLAKSDSRAYERIFQRARTIAQSRLETMEFDEFGVTHAEVSAAMLENWEVPKSLVTLVLNHHPRENAPKLSETEQQFLRTMRVGEALANLTMLPSPHRHRALAAQLDPYGRRTDECRACIAEGAAKAKEFAKIFSLPDPDDTVLRDVLMDVGASGPLDDVVGQIFTRELTAGLDLDDRQPARSSHPAEHHERRPRVLCIDGESGMLEATSTLLNSEGFEVVSCHDPQAAASLAMEIDLVLCDFHVGPVNGLEVVRWLQAAGHRAPVVIASDDCTRTTVLACIRAGIADFIVKPFKLSELGGKLRLTLQKTAAHSGARVASANVLV